MAANMEVPNETKDCYVCREPYDDPKLLPCIHAFCKKCLQTTAVINTQENGGGGTMPCPICMEPFSIPPDGFDGLPTDPFLSRLTKEATPEDRRCAVCQDRTRETNEADVLVAVESCSECQRLTKLPGIAQTLPRGVSEARDCGIHPQVKLTLYCKDCEEVICASCFETSHQNHKLQSTKTAAEDFRDALQISRLSSSKTATVQRMKELHQGLLRLQENADDLRASVQKRRESIEELVEKHAQSLLKNIESEELRLETENERIGKEHELQVTCLNSFESYCREILEKGSPDDICCVMPKLKRRSDELVKRHDKAEQLQLRTPRYVPPEFRGSDLEEFHGEDGFNIIGCIIGFGGQKSTKISRKEKIAGLKEQLKIERNQTREKNLNLQKKVEELKETRQENLNWREEVDKLKQDLDHHQRLIAELKGPILLMDERESEQSRLVRVNLQNQLEQMTVAKKSLERQMDGERTHNHELCEFLRRRIETLEAEQGLNRRVEELGVEQMRNRTEIDRLSDEISILKTLVPGSNLRERRRYGLRRNLIRKSV